MIMTCNEMIPAIGNTVLVKFESLEIKCAVRDVKHVYGNVRLLVAPLSGNGHQWVEMTRIKGVMTANSLIEVA